MADRILAFIGAIALAGFATGFAGAMLDGIIEKHMIEVYGFRALVSFLLAYWLVLRPSRC